MSPRPFAKPPGALHVHRVVSDMKQSIDWYIRSLGFYYDHGILETAWLTAPGLLLTLSPGEPQPDPLAYFGFALGSLEELDAAYAKLYAAQERLSSPPDPPAGRPFFFIYDPDDYPLIFSFSQMDYPEKMQQMPEQS